MRCNWSGRALSAAAGWGANSGANCSSTSFGRRSCRRAEKRWPEKVLRLLVINRLLDPGSEFRVHRQWFDQSAMAELLETGFTVAEKDQFSCRIQATSQTCANGSEY